VIAIGPFAFTSTHAGFVEAGSHTPKSSNYGLSRQYSVLRDGSYYTGHTHNLDRRTNEHEVGCGGYTCTRRPVLLVYAKYYASHEEAISAERQTKGRSRAKKEALIAGDRDRVALLARNR